MNSNPQGQAFVNIADVKLENDGPPGLIVGKKAVAPQQSYNLGQESLV